MGCGIRYKNLKMIKEQRVSKISSLILNTSNKIGEVEIHWKKQLTSFPVFKIPLTYLLFNPYNGRIASQIKTIEKHRGNIIDISDKEDQELIKKLIWHSKVDKNKKTLNNLKEKGQLIHATITKDGVLIDGNRRGMLLSKLQETYIKAIVLPVTLEEDPISIQELEYEYQIAVDEKLDYNPIEKYIKVKDLYDRYKLSGVDNNKIFSDLAKLNGFKKTEHKKVELLLSVYDLMVDYLKSINAEGYLVLLEKKEDLFLTLNSWMSTFLNSNGSNKESKKGFEGYDENDVLDLKELCFDYIQAEFEGKKFREIASGNRGSHLFSNKHIWSQFYKKHIEIIKNNYEANFINSNSETYVEELKSRSVSFKKNHSKKFLDNLNNFKYSLDKKIYEEEPVKNISQIQGVLTDHNIRSKIKTDKRVVNELKEVSYKISELLSVQPLIQLENVKNTILNIDVDYLIVEDDKENFKNLLSEVNKLLFKIKKSL